MLRKYIFISALFVQLVNAQDIEYRGTYVTGHEVDTFRLCNEKEVYWVSYGWGAINADLKGTHAKYTDKPYQAIYIEFKGHFHFEKPDGFAQQYDGIIHISKMNDISATIPVNCI